MAHKHPFLLLLLLLLLFYLCLLELPFLALGLDSPQRLLQGVLGFSALQVCFERSHLSFSGFEGSIMHNRHSSFAIVFPIVYVTLFFFFFFNGSLEMGEVGHHF
jgi:hypothetical protein